MWRRGGVEKRPTAYYYLTSCRSEDVHVVSEEGPLIHTQHILHLGIPKVE